MFLLRGPAFGVSGRLQLSSPLPVASQPDDEVHRLTVAPRRGPARGLEDGDHFLGVQLRIGVERPRTPSRGDVGMDRHPGLCAPIGGAGGYVTTLPAGKSDAQ